MSFCQWPLIDSSCLLRCHRLSTYAKLFGKKYQGEENVSFLKNFAYALNGWPLKLSCRKKRQKLYRRKHCTHHGHNQLKPGVENHVNSI